MRHPNGNFLLGLAALALTLVLVPACGGGGSGGSAGAAPPVVTPAVVTVAKKHSWNAPSFIGGTWNGSPVLVKSVKFDPTASTDIMVKAEVRGVASGFNGNAYLMAELFSGATSVGTKLFTVPGGSGTQGFCLTFDVSGSMSNNQSMLSASFWTVKFYVTATEPIGSGTFTMLNAAFFTLEGVEQEVNSANITT